MLNINTAYGFDTMFSHEEFLDIMRGVSTQHFDDELGGLVVHEYGYADIEINLCDVSEKNSEFVVPYIDYCICVHHSDNKYDWETDGFLCDVASAEECQCNVDWNADDWDEQLEKDMHDKLLLYCTRMGYDYTKPIVYDRM